MNDNQQAIDVLKRARQEIIKEIIRSGDNGGVGRAQNYSPILNNLHQSIQILMELDENKPVIREETVVVEDPKKEFAQKMQAARAAKKSAQQQ